MCHPKTLLSRLLLPIVIALSAAMLLPACGQKGRLYLPDQSIQSQNPEQSTEQATSQPPEANASEPDPNPDEDAETEPHDGQAP